MADVIFPTGFSELTEVINSTVLYVDDGVSNHYVMASVLKTYIWTDPVIIGNVVVSLDKAYYIGNTDADGSWRINRNGNNLVFERRESGNWVIKSTINS